MRIVCISSVHSYRIDSLPLLIVPKQTSCYWCGSVGEKRGGNFTTRQLLNMDAVRKPLQIRHSVVIESTLPIHRGNNL